MRAISELYQKARTLLGGKARKDTTKPPVGMAVGYSQTSIGMQYSRFTKYGMTTWTGKGWSDRSIAMLFGHDVQWWKVALLYYQQLHPGAGRHYSWSEIERACSGWTGTDEMDDILDYAAGVTKFFDSNPQYADLVLPTS